ncbi:hypothetical protein FACS1894172_00540 [Spirochaetia bacterium]|nr:hypothetical protein FACS1894164_07330 [Spirochaetia bacterium]GHU29432.1 hypothetical protein FACS1894172_00540 [Spirochaetia bacterium]
MDDVEEVMEEEQTEDFRAERVYCANCIHCKLISVKTGENEQTELRIRCAAEKWKKKLGQEKMYKYSTVARRFWDNCDQYGEMGETDDFIRELRKIQEIEGEISQ